MKMTRTILMAAAAIMVAFSSCVKEQEAGGENPEVKGNASMKVVLNHEVVNKAFDYEDPVSKQKVAIENIYLIPISDVGNVMGSFIAYGSATDFSGPTPKEFPVTTACEKIVVIANLGKTTTGFNEKFFADNYSTYTQLAAAAQDFKHMTVNTPGLSTNVTKPWMAAESAVGDFVARDGKDPLATVNVTLNVIPARIDLSIWNIMDKQTEDGAIDIKQIAINFCGRYTTFVPKTVGGETTFVPSPTQMLNEQFYSGTISNNKIPYTPPMPLIYQGADTDRFRVAWQSKWNGPSYVAALKAICDGKGIEVENATKADKDLAMSNAKASITDKCQHTFYALPTTGFTNAKPVTIALRSEQFLYDEEGDPIYNVDGDDTSGHKMQHVFHTIFFSTTDAGGNVDENSQAADGVLKNGKRYTVSMTLRGDATKGSGGGNNTEEEIIDADIVVVVSPGEWDPIIINDKIFE